jgi:transcriptional regulator with XRE-family HTH domain
VQAVGAYFDELVRLRDLKVKAVTKAAEVGPNYISRLLAGDTKEPAAATLRRLTLALGGSWENVGRLLEPAASQLTDEELEEAITLFKRLKSDCISRSRTRTATSTMPRSTAVITR